MKKGETADLQRARDVMQHIFSQIQSNGELKAAYDEAKTGQSPYSVEGQLVSMAMQLDCYIKKHI